MATSGTYNFSPTVQQLTDEAFERCRIDPATLTSRHLRSARYSLQLLFTDTLNLGGLRQWKIDQEQQTLTEGDYDYTLPAGTLDILSAVLRRDGNDTEMTILSRDEYFTIVDKDQEGRPDRIFVDRQRDSRIMYVWQAPENSTDIIVYNRLIMFEDVGDATNTLDVAPMFMEAVHAGLALKLAGKFAVNEVPRLERDFASAMIAAKNEDRERGSLTIGFRYGR